MTEKGGQRGRNISVQSEGREREGEGVKKKASV